MQKLNIFLLCLLTPFCVVMPMCMFAEAGVQSLTVDAARSIGRIKAMQDLDNGPLCQRGIVDLSRYYKELGVRYVRLHDVPWTYDNAFDINYVFPNWKADPDKPENYDFTQTDFYLKTITSLDIKVIYRLGYSAEYKTAVHHNAPPDSYSKFAKLCTQIIRHHNEGWANGQKAEIQYWEIWNEPDGKTFWAGSPEQFYRLYVETAKTVKKAYPSLKVGGPALASNLGFLEGFLKYCHEHDAPLDFVSWHIYTQDPHEVARRAQRVHALMTQYGYAKAESILDEWNYGPTDWKKLFVDPAASKTYFDATQNAYGAAFDGTVLTDLQDAPLDIATYYSGTTLMWGMFSSAGVPLKPYYAFLAFKRLLDTPKRVAMESAHDPGITTVAGLSEDGKMLRVMISNTTRETKNLKLQLKGLAAQSRAYERRIVDASHDLDVIGTGTLTGSNPVLSEQITGPSVTLLSIAAKE
jgi:xylan 1,4-beta-xylosidase